MSKGNTLNDLLQLKSFPRYTRWLWQCWYGTHPLCSQVVMVPTCCCRGGQTEFEASVFCCIIKSRYFGQLRMLYEISKGLVATFCLQSFMVWSVCQVPVERGYLFWTRHWQRRLHCNGWHSELRVFPLCLLFEDKHIWTACGEQWWRGMIPQVLPKGMVLLY